MCKYNRGCYLELQPWLQNMFIKIYFPLCSFPHINISNILPAGVGATPAELREHLIEKLRLVLASGSDEECSVCLDSIRLPVITHCAHVFCRPCIAQVISTDEVRVLPSADSSGLQIADN